MKSDQETVEAFQQLYDMVNAALDAGMAGSISRTCATMERAGAALSSERETTSGVNDGAQEISAGIKRVMFQVFAVGDNIPQIGIDQELVPSRSKTASGGLLGANGLAMAIVSSLPF